MRLYSTAFKPGERMPSKYTCEGENINPELVIEEIPAEAESLVLIVDDPDSPAGSFIHWLMYDIPIVGKIKENSAPGIMGKNDFGSSKYAGPCPKKGVHCYHFKLYALNKKLDLETGKAVREIREAMKGHVVDVAEFACEYSLERARV